jgi:hypothetical protein
MKTLNTKPSLYYWLLSFSLFALSSHSAYAGSAHSVAELKYSAKPVSKAKPKAKHVAESAAKTTSQAAKEGPLPTIPVAAPAIPVSVQTLSQPMVGGTVAAAVPQVLGTATANTQGPPSPYEISSDGLIQKLKAQDFSCHASGVHKNVQRCYGKIDGYPQGVLFFVPDHLDTQKTLNLVYHFHGFNIYPGKNALETHFNEADGSGDFASWISEGHLNGVVIAPTSVGHCTTFFHYFSDSGDTRQFFEGTQKLILGSLGKTFADTKISLSSHSGSDTTLSYLAKTLSESQKVQLSAIGLFDSMYAEHPTLESMIVKHHLKVYDSFLPNGSTRRHQNEFINSLSDDSTQLTVVHVMDATHMTLMSKDQFTDFLEVLPR